MTTLTPALTREFMTILNALSPENLHWDGERSRAAAKKAARGLKARWRTLEATLGRTVSEDEVWAAFLTTPRSPAF